METTAPTAPVEKKLSLHEDWAAVLLGGMTILLSIFWLVVPVPKFSWATPEALMSKVLGAENLGKVAFQFIYVFVAGTFGIMLIGKPVRNFIMAFPLIFLLTVIAVIITGNGFVKSLNLESVIFSLSLGLLISNTINLPEWFRNALSTELFVKIGLVLLGTGVIFSDILKAGSLGLIQSLVVVVSVWYFAYWLCKRLKVDGELTMMISSAVSICGVSAAIATAGAIKGDTKKLSYVISLVLVTAIPMMIFMPLIARHFGFSEAVTGAWLGGSIDTTGAVVASGSLVGETALKISTIVKFSQNVLLGIAALAISVFWTYTNKKQDAGTPAKPTLAVIWERFPKFVLGFIAASLIFSFLLNKGTLDTVKDSLKNIQTLWFTLAFTCIGLETKFSDLFNSESRKPLYAFLIAQFFNILITLVIAFMLFS